MEGRTGYFFPRGPQTSSLVPFLGLLWRTAFAGSVGKSGRCCRKVTFKATVKDQTFFFLNVWDSRYARKRTISERKVAGRRDGFGQVLGPECRRGGRQCRGSEVMRLEPLCSGSIWLCLSLRVPLSPSLSVSLCPRLSFQAVSIGALPGAGRSLQPGESSGTQRWSF